MIRRTVCVATSSRADYGHMQWMIRDIAAHPALRLQLIVTGTHLEERFGLTYREIEADGFAIDEKVPLDQTDDTPLGIAAAMGRGLTGMARALDRLRPDILVVLGDRFEIMTAAQAAMVCRIPIAHLHGGEATEGLMDEAIRHSITKMAHLHFVAAAPYARRVVQLGEQPSRVFNVGTPGLCALDRAPLMSRPELERSLGFPLGERFFLATYHPVTLSADGPARAVNAMLTALEGQSGARIVITGVNADTANSQVEAACQAFARQHPDRVLLATSLGHHRYLSALKHCTACVGNSSSGIVEAPALGVPTINMGPRQQGRLKAATVIDCGESEAEISQALETAQESGFLSAARAQMPPYGRGGASARIVETLAAADLNGILIKTFFNLPQPDGAP